MVHTISPLYLKQLESRKNWLVFAAYVLVIAAGVVLSQQVFRQLSNIAEGLYALAVIAVALSLHLWINHAHQRGLKAAANVQVELMDDSLIYRTNVQETVLFLETLKTVKRTQGHDALELRFADGRTLGVQGLSDTDILLHELEQRIRSEGTTPC